MEQRGETRELNYIYNDLKSRKEDHRKVGRKLDLFHFSTKPRPGLLAPQRLEIVPAASRLYASKTGEAGYIEVNTPDVMDRSLWETSGHWFNYRENMFSTQTEDDRILL